MRMEDALYKIWAEILLKNLFVIARNFISKMPFDEH